jgi:hypothetical protein
MPMQKLFITGSKSLTVILEVLSNFWFKLIMGSNNQKLPRVFWNMQRKIYC